MTRVAAEMNLSETAFLVRRDQDFDLRWFTPAVEVDLCGHATLASAHVLWESSVVPRNELIRFHTKSGLLTARSESPWIELDFPATPAIDVSAPPELSTALGVTPVAVCTTRFDYLVEVESEQVVRSLAPDIDRLATFPVRGVVVTSRASTPGVDFVSRFFAPASGIAEDPATGSAHCALAPYWSPKFGGQTSFLARQLSARGGELQVVLDGNRVRLRGQAVTVFRGELCV